MALTPSEFEHIIEAYWRPPNRELGLCGAASASFQLSMIGQMDDTLKFCNPNLYPYQIYPDYGMCGRLLWSENVGDERDAPTQVLLATIDTRYDVHSNLGLWLEYHFEQYHCKNVFVFGYNVVNDSICTKVKIVIS